MPPEVPRVRIAVIGSGSWGTAIARLLGARYPDVRLWAYEGDLVETMRSTGENAVYLPGFPLPPSVVPFNDPAELGDPDVVVWASPSHVARRVVSSFVPHLKGTELSVSLVKGIEEETLLTMSGILAELLPPGARDRVTVLSGPSFAKEVAAGLPAAVKLLYDRNPRVQAAAVLAVVGMGQTAVPPLVQLLQDPDPKARLRAVKTLEFLGMDAKEAIPALKEAVHDDNPGVRRAAQRAVKTVSTKTKPTVLRSRRSPWQRPPAGPDILPPR